MKRHDTPNDVARELAKHAPRRLRNILDPAVGSGALLRPLSLQLKKQGSKVFCIDSDATAISQARDSLSLLIPTGVSYINADFLNWSQGKESIFDCIVMNPPFAAGKSELRQVHLSHDLRKVAGRDRFMPLEAAFVCHAIELLRENGRLLTVLPCSIVMSESTQWLRDLLLSVGRIRFVHELPPRSFPNVESRMYLFIFDKAGRQRKIILFNHDLADPERLDLWLGNQNRVERLDFGYHRATEKLKRLMHQERFGWQTVGDMAVIIRGDIDSPLGSACAVHTSDFVNGFWRRSQQQKSPKLRNLDRCIRRGDLLVKRIGRDCHRSLGRPISLQGMPCSDCVLIIRPKHSRVSTRLLFSLKILLEMEWSKSLLERGTGASYISHDSLRNLPIPTKLHECFPKTFASFVAAQNGRSPDRLRRAIRHAVSRLDRIVRTNP